jgi:hypothetical protein
VKDSWEKTIKQKWCSELPDQFDVVTGTSFEHGLFFIFLSLCSPLPPAFNRILQVGDASGIQSPISFGRFAAITQHLSRLSSGITFSLLLFQGLVFSRCIILVHFIF